MSSEPIVTHREYVTDEDETTIWFPGHVEPAEFLAGVRAQLAEWGEWSPTDLPFDGSVEDVAHVWMAENPELGDDLYHCDAATPGAVPFTEIRL